MSTPTRTPTATRFEYAALTDVGQVRSNNEDAVLVDPAHGIAILADGMGGYNAGEVASALAVDLIGRELARWLEQASATATARDVRRAMEICVDNASHAIFDAANTHTAYAGMGTTLAMAVLHGEVLVVGHVGDSRVYRWRDGLLTQLTRDHSLLQEQLDIGLITASEAAASTSRSLVTRALGVEDTVLLEAQEFSVQPGDAYLICSDGLTDMVPDEEIVQWLSSTLTTEQRAARLIECANTNGGRDNVSVVLLQMIAPPKKTGVISKLLRK